MISFVVKHDYNKRVNGFTCSGHAGYSEKGTDIVCAAVSVLTQTAVLALERLVGLRLMLKIDPESGFMDCSWENIPSKMDDADLLIRTVVLGLNEIQKQYPDHLRINEVEV